MPIWFNTLGVACIGSVCGYVTFYALKRHQPPTTQAPLPITEVIALLTAVGAGGVIGGIFVALEGINYIGGYGIGLLLGVIANILLTIFHENPFGVQFYNSDRSLKMQEREDISTK